MRHDLFRLAPSICLVAGLVCAAAGLAPPAAAQFYPPMPPPRYEPMPPPPAGPGYVWRAGHWRWTGNGYAWVPGSYVFRHAGGNEWVPGHWAIRHGQQVWISAHWR